MVKNWPYISLSQCCSFIGGGTPSKKEISFWNGKIPWISSADIGENDINRITVTRFITDNAITHSATHLCPPNTIHLVSRVGVGKLAISKEALCTSQDYTNLIPHYHNIVYLAYTLLPIMQKMALEAQGTSIKGITTPKIKQIQVPFPSLEEQNAIATALSDVDELISNLEKLIEKKKNIKHGVMQELLTGKRRLPGFEGEWFPVNMAQNARIKARIGWQGLTTAEYLNSGYSLLITGTDFCDGFIKWNGCHYVTKDRYDQDTNIQIRNGDVLITKDGTIGKVAIVKGLTMPATLNSGVFVIRPNNSVFTEQFLYYVLMSEIFKSFIAELMAGSTITHLYQKDIVKFNFMVPPTVEEQNAIADTIESMENEILTLQAKLKKYRLLKQGMMQKLLTGEIRLG